MDDAAREIDLPETEVSSPPTGKFAWIDRLRLVEALAAELADNGGKYELALRRVKLSEYAYHVSKMTVKHRAALKRDVKAQAKVLIHDREAADIGDIVRVPKLITGPLGMHRDGSKLVEAEIVSKYTVSSVHRYRVRRLADGGLQDGNGHMIKAIVRRAADNKEGKP